MKITIQQIAEMAGVSRGTVDKVLHDRPGVSAQVRNHVQQIIAASGYQTPGHRRASNSKNISLPHIAVMMPRLGNHFFEDVQEGMRSVLESYEDYEQRIQFYFYDNLQINSPLSILDYLEKQPCDAIIIRGMQSRKLHERLQQFYARGVTVFLMDSEMEEAPRQLYIGPDNRRGGRMAASLLAKSIGRKGDIAIISGSRQVSGHKRREEGFRRLIETAYPRIQILESVETLEQGAIAFEETRRILQDYPQLRGIFVAVSCAGDVVRAVLESARPVRIVAYNFTDDVCSLITAGFIDYTVGVLPRSFGRLVMNSAIQYLTQNRIPKKKSIESPLFIGMDQNIDQIMYLLY